MTVRMALDMRCNRSSFPSLAASVSLLSDTSASSPFRSVFDLLLLNSFKSASFDSTFRNPSSLIVLEADFQLVSSEGKDNPLIHANNRDLLPSALHDINDISLLLEACE